MRGCRHTSSQAKEGVAGCQTTKQAQQAGAGGQEYLPSEERPGAPGNPPADRDETRQVSNEVSSTFLRICDVSVEIFALNIVLLVVVQHQVV